MGVLCIVPSEKGEVVQPGSLKIVHSMGLPQRFSGHIKGHLYIVMDVKLPLSKTLSSKQIDTFKAILPEQVISDNENENEEEESKMNGNSDNNGIIIIITSSKNHKITKRIIIIIIIKRGKITINGKI